MRADTPISRNRLPEALASDLDLAFPSLVTSLQDAVFSGALRMTGSRSDAEDISQEAFARAYRALGSYPPERVRSLDLRAWVWTIAANLCRNRARSLSRRPETLLVGLPPSSDPAPGPEQEALDAAEARLLASHLVRLPWPMRAAVVLRHVVDLGYPEIAAALGRPEGTVKADVHRGLQRLRVSLEEHR
jgi:RNA polymerase sigma factor (sigma-70 family)